MVGRSVLEINFFCYLVFEVVAKLKYLVEIIDGYVLAWLPPIVRFMT